MKRIPVQPRKDWQKLVEAVGLTYHTVNGEVYWNESAYYEFSAREIDGIEKATATLQEMCLAAGQHIIDQNRFNELSIPQAAVPMIVKTWNEEPPALYGRFDLAYDGHRVKLLEYNADTPTSLVECAVAQWRWLQDIDSSKDQFNSLHEKLIAKWKELKPYFASPEVCFAGVLDREDEMNVLYLMDTAQQAGIDVSSIEIQQVGWDSEKREFVDIAERPIRTMFKLYPWEMMVKDQFGKNALEQIANGGTMFIEPIWKMMLSNKGLLAILWELYPNHEYLLPAKIGSPVKSYSYVRKPLLSREGANIEVYRDGRRAFQSGGQYDDGKFVYQEFFDIPDFDGNRPVLGSWVIGPDQPAGMGIRETSGLVTNNFSRFVPHIF